MKRGDHGGVLLQESELFKVNVYVELVNSLDVKKGDKIWLSSELIQLVFVCRKIGVQFDTSDLLNQFQNSIGEEGTLMLPTFCFEFSNCGYYDYLHSKGTTGVLGNVALDRTDFRRTRHPMHSFAVWGKDQDLLCDMENKHAFGTDSPFEYCRKNNVKQIMLGTDYVHAMTFVHYAETRCNVPYRFTKSFTGMYVTQDGIEEERTYDYAARDLNIQTTEQFNRIGQVLESEGIAQVREYNGYQSHIVNLGDSYDVICDDIFHNQCRNIYDFDISREEIFKGFGEK